VSALHEPIFGTGGFRDAVECVPQWLNSLLKNPVFDGPAPEGASDSEELTASLKRCPDTKLLFFRSL
jgi:hypothetical protein